MFHLQFIFLSFRFYFHFLFYSLFVLSSFLLRHSQKLEVTVSYNSFLLFLVSCRQALVRQPAKLLDLQDELNSFVLGKTSQYEQ
jgi:hypothetical protein